MATSEIAGIVPRRKEKTSGAWKEIKDLYMVDLAWKEIKNFYRVDLAVSNLLSDEKHTTDILVAEWGLLVYFLSF